MSAISTPIPRKRTYSSDLRDRDSDSEDSLPQRKKHRKAEGQFVVPKAFKERLQKVTHWLLEFKHLNNFARMAFKCGGTIWTHNSLIDDEEEDSEEDEDDVLLDDDDDDDIQEIKENVNQKLVNGSSFCGSQFNSHMQNGVPIRDLSTRYHGKTNCNLKCEQSDKRKRKPLVSNPPAEIVLEDEPEIVVPEGDDIEVLSDLSSSNKKSATSQKPFHSSVKSSKNASSVNKQARSVPVDKSFQSYKFYTANDVVRLDEKAQYKLLLQKYMDRPQRRCPMEPESVKEIKEDTKMAFKKHVLEQPVDSFIEKYCKPCQLLPSKSKESGEKKKKTVEITLDDDNENDVVVVEMKQSNYKAKFKYPLFTNGWLSELKHNVNLQNKETNKIVEDYERELEKLKTERLIRQLKIDSSDTESEQEFPELTPEMIDVIEKLSSNETAEAIIRTMPNNQLSKADFDTLNGLHWLNDNVINSYFDLIVERSKKKGYPSVYAFTTFFYGNLKTKGYAAVRRWTRKIDLFSFDIVFIPIHLTYHWCLGVIDNRQKKICYYDSMGTGEEDCLNLFQDYLISEYKDKKNKDLNPAAYSLEIMRDIPQQMNGSDCGMFTVKYAEYISRNAEITFNQDHMSYFRRRAMYEIISKQLL